MTGERYLTYLFKVQGSHDMILIHSAGSSLGNLIHGLTQGQESLCVPRTQRFSNYIWGQPDQDARARKQERHNYAHRTIESKNPRGYWSYLDPRNNSRTEQHQLIQHQICSSNPIHAKENCGIKLIQIPRDLSILRKVATIFRTNVISNR